VRLIDEYRDTKYSSMSSFKFSQRRT
jgi:hypothetical protein